MGLHCLAQQVQFVLPDGTGISLLLRGRKENFCCRFWALLSPSVYSGTKYGDAL